MPSTCYLLSALLLCSIHSIGQSRTDSIRLIQLKEINVLGYKTSNGIGHLTENSGQTIYAGKKTEVILTDSVDANKAINNTRQILGRIPGLTIVESETGGFVANGIGVRGLNPSQSIEMNVRQNGYTIAADVYGYNETYYLPPMEAVQRIEVVKGGASLAFGSQFGGMVNYVLRSGPADRRFTYSTMQTGGSFGLFNSYHAVGGTVGKLNYFGFGQYRTLDGWRPASGQRQFSGYAKLTYQLRPKLTAGIEYSALRNRIQMPGGLTDEQYEDDPRQSVRNRNFLRSPWNVLTASLTYTANSNTSISLKTTYLHGERSLVWFDEGPDELDLPNASGVYSRRDIEREFVRSSSTEIRLLTNHRLGAASSTLAGGVRLAYSSFQRREDGRGTNGADFDLTLTSGYDEILDFTTFNVAPFLENTFRFGSRLSVTPGIRLEYLESEIEGEIEDEGAGQDVDADDERSRIFALLGVGAQYQVSSTTQLYANASQAYRPITYADLTPLGVSSRVDPNLKDAKGYTIDLGVRGMIRNILNLDIGVFYLTYNNRIGLIAQTLNGQQSTLRTNVANSVHQGVESYLELNLLNWLAPRQRGGHLSVFDSFALVDAHYTTGPFKGNRVEYAPRLINRIGVTYRYKTASVTGQLSQQSTAFGDATNARRSENGVVGAIPAYQVADVSATYQLGIVRIKAGVNNFTDKRYFTQRTDEYPGPGIIPSIGRNAYVGIGLTL